MDCCEFLHPIEMSKIVELFGSIWLTRYARNVQDWNFDDHFAHFALIVFRKMLNEFLAVVKDEVVFRDEIAASIIAAEQEGGNPELYHKEGA